MQYKSILTALLAVTAAFQFMNAAPRAFDFKDPKGVNNVQFKLDAPLESISGTGTGISGVVNFDPATPEKTSGKIELATESLTVGNPVMAEHLRGAHWLNVQEFPSIRFELDKLENIRSEKGQILGDAKGKLTIKDVTKEVKLPVRFTYLEGKLGDRLNDASIKGDLLVIRSQFSINRSDYNIQPGKNADKVAEEINLSLSIAGASLSQ